MSDKNDHMFYYFPMDLSFYCWAKPAHLDENNSKTELYHFFFFAERIIPLEFTQNYKKKIIRLDKSLLFKYYAIIK